MNRKQIKQIVMGGLLAAVIALLTSVIKLPVPATGGYVHLGDGAIFLAAFLMGPWAAIPAAVGSALADILGGYAVYAVPTALIKGAMGWISGRMISGEQVIRNGFVLILCEIVMAAGYFVFEWVMYGAGAALGAVVPNLIQGAAGVVLGMVMLRAGQSLRGHI